MAELKPCPFCGWSVYIQKKIVKRYNWNGKFVDEERFSIVHYDRDGYTIICFNKEMGNYLNSDLLKMAWNARTLKVPEDKVVVNESDLKNWHSLLLRLGSHKVGIELETKEMERYLGFPLPDKPKAGV